MHESPLLKRLQAPQKTSTDIQSVHPRANPETQKQIHKVKLLLFADYVGNITVGSHHFFVFCFFLLFFFVSKQKQSDLLFLFYGHTTKIIQLLYVLFSFCFMLCFELFSLLCLLCMVGFSARKSGTLYTHLKDY